MSRRVRVVLVIAAGIVAALVARLIDARGNADALSVLAAMLVIGEVLVLRLEDGSGIPLSYAGLIVLAAAFPARDFALAVAAAELISLLLRFTEPTRAWRIDLFLERLAVAAATFVGYRLVDSALDLRETVATVLLALGAAAAAQMLTDVGLRWLLRLGASFSNRGRLAWLVIASSGMLMAIGYRGVDGEGAMGIWGPILFSTPLLAAWYAFQRLDSATRSFRQTIQSLAMAPELGGLVPAGHAERVTTLCAEMAGELGLGAAEVTDLEMAALLHHLGQVTLDEPSPDRHSSHAEVAAVTGALMRDIRPLAAAGDIVAGDSDDPGRRLAAQILRVASEFDDMTVRDNTPSTLAVETLRWAPGYVYDPRVVSALEHIVRDRMTGT